MRNELSSTWSKTSTRALGSIGNSQSWIVAHIKGRDNSVNSNGENHENQANVVPDVGFPLVSLFIYIQSGAKENTDDALEYLQYVMVGFCRERDKCNDEKGVRGRRSERDKVRDWVKKKQKKKIIETTKRYECFKNKDKW